MFRFISLFILFLISACSSSTDSQLDQEVNLLGVWDFEMTSQNFVCDGFVAQGIWTFNSLNGDNTKIGSVRIQGEGFSDDGSGGCFYASVDEVVTSIQGSPSTVTLAQYQEDLNNESDSKASVVSQAITSFSNAKIVFVLEAANGIILTTTITR